MLQTHPYELVMVPPGTRWTIVGLELDGGRRPVLEYLDGAGIDAEAFFAFCGYLLKLEPFQVFGRKFKHLRHVSNIHQMTIHKDRYLGFRWKNALVMTNGFRKTSSETPPSEIEKCSSLQATFFQQYGS